MFFCEYWETFKNNFSQNTSVRLFLSIKFQLCSSDDHNTTVPCIQLHISQKKYMALFPARTISGRFHHFWLSQTSSDYFPSIFWTSNCKLFIKKCYKLIHKVSKYKLSGYIVCEDILKMSLLNKLSKYVFIYKDIYERIPGASWKRKSNAMGCKLKLCNKYLKGLFRSASRIFWKGRGVKNFATGWNMVS